MGTHTPAPCISHSIIHCTDSSDLFFLMTVIYGRTKIYLAIPLFMDVTLFPGS